MSEDQRVKIIWTIVVSLAVLGFVGLSSLCATLFFKNYADPAVLTSIIAITSGVIGSLGTLAVQKPQSQNQPDITVSTPPPTVEVTHTAQ